MKTNSGTFSFAHIHKPRLRISAHEETEKITAEKSAETSILTCRSVIRWSESGDAEKKRGQKKARKSRTLWGEERVYRIFMGFFSHSYLVDLVKISHYFVFPIIATEIFFPRQFALSWWWWRVCSGFTQISLFVIMNNWEVDEAV